MEVGNTRSSLNSLVLGGMPFQKNRSDSSENQLIVCHDKIQLAACLTDVGSSNDFFSGTVLHQSNVI